LKITDDTKGIANVTSTDGSVTITKNDGVYNLAVQGGGGGGYAVTCTGGTLDVTTDTTYIPYIKQYPPIPIKIYRLN
jgi:hypothetical protein